MSIRLVIRTRGANARPVFWPKSIASAPNSKMFVLNNISIITKEIQHILVKYIRQKNYKRKHQNIKKFIKTLIKM